MTKYPQWASNHHNKQLIFASIFTWPLPPLYHLPACYWATHLGQSAASSLQDREWREHWSTQTYIKRRHLYVLNDQKRSYKTCTEALLREKQREDPRKASRNSEGEKNTRSWIPPSNTGSATQVREGSSAAAQVQTGRDVLSRHELKWDGNVNFSFISLNQFCDQILV